MGRQIFFVIIFVTFFIINTFAAEPLPQTRDEDWGSHDPRRCDEYLAYKLPSNIPPVPEHLSSRPAFDSPLEEVPAKFYGIAYLSFRVLRHDINSNVKNILKVAITTVPKTEKNLPVFEKGQIIELVDDENILPLGDLNVEKEKFSNIPITLKDIEGGQPYFSIINSSEFLIQVAKIKLKRQRKNR